MKSVVKIALEAGVEKQCLVNKWIIIIREPR